MTRPETASSSYLDSQPFNLKLFESSKSTSLDKGAKVPTASSNASRGKPAARVDDKVSCPIHGTASPVTGSPNTMFDYKPALVVGNRTACDDTIIEGSSSVFINGKPAAVVGCTTAHGGTIVTGSPTVFIGTGVPAVRREPPEAEPSDRQKYSLGFDFSAMHEAGNHNGIDYGNMPIEITDTDGTYITTVRTDGTGVSDRFFSIEQKEIIGWMVGSDHWEVLEEYEVVEEEDVLEVDE